MTGRFFCDKILPHAGAAGASSTSPSSTGRWICRPAQTRKLAGASAAFCHRDSSQASCHGLSISVLLPRLMRKP